MASLFAAAFEDVERLVARTVTEAASAVVESTSEFPKPSTEPARHAKLVVPVSTNQAAQQARKAKSSWEEFDWQVNILLSADCHGCMQQQVLGAPAAVLLLQLAVASWS
jgi:hypothetical protein